MRVKWLFLSLFALSVNAFAGERCLTIEWNVSPDSTMIGKQDDGPENFAKVNGSPVSFYPDQLSFQYGANNKVLSSLSRGCFNSDLLLIGKNEFSIQYFAKNLAKTDRIYGTSSARFILNRGLPEAKTLCSAVKYPGLNDGTSCNISVSLELKEIDPQMASQIEQYKAQIEKQKKDLVRLKGLKVEDLKALEAKLEQLANTDFESLNRDQLLQVDAELAATAEMIEGFKKSLDELKDKYIADLNAQKQAIESYRQSADTALSLSDVDLKDLNFYSQHDLAALDLTSIVIPRTAEDEESFDENDNVYLTLESNAMEKLKRFEAERDWDGFDAAVSTWSNTVQFLGQALEIRREVAPLAEFEIFNQSVKRVKDWIAIRVDDQGFPRNSTIPESVRRTIKEDIEPENPDKAKELRQAIARWQKGLLSPQQVLVLDTVEGIGAGYRALRETKEDNQAEVRSMLDRVLSQAIDVAKDVGRLAIAFTPLNDFVDFCEVATAREFCLPDGKELTAVERGITALGLFIGSGQFWRKFGGSYLKKPVQEAMEFTSRLAGRMEARAKLLFSSIRREMKLSVKQEAYLLKVFGTGTDYEKERIVRILTRFADLESRMKGVAGRSLDAVITRGIGKSTAVKMENVAEEIWALNRYSLRSTGRYDIGGMAELGNNVVYAALGNKEATGQLIRAELRNPAKFIVEETKVSLKKVLDLTDEKVRVKLGLSYSELINKAETDLMRYDLTQQIGDLAISLGFEGIMAPSAQLENGVNLILLKAIR